MNIAIIGAGIAGLTIANQLKHIANVTVFEKSRGFGGRIATRTASKFKFDHGAQFFTARHPKFIDFIQKLLAADVVDIWQGRFIELAHQQQLSNRFWTTNNPHYVGVPTMNAIGKYLAQNIDVELNTKIVRIECNGSWQLFNSKYDCVGQFDWVIMAIPPAQVLELLPQNCSFYQDIVKVKMAACFSLMLGFNDVLDLGFDAALVSETDISWISVNSSKPNRNSATALLVHSTNKWADSNLHTDFEQVKQYLLTELTRIIAIPQVIPHIDLHLWRFANLNKQDIMLECFDSDMQLIACGDWCYQGRIEAAFLSALTVVDKLKFIISSA